MYNKTYWFPYKSQITTLYKLKYNNKLKYNFVSILIYIIKYIVLCVHQNLKLSDVC